MVIYESTGGSKGLPETERSASWSTAGSRGEVLDYLSGWECEFDVDAIMEAIREENHDATTIDDIDTDAFAYIIESNAL